MDSNHDKVIPELLHRAFPALNARAFPGPNAADAALRASLSAGSDDFDDEVERELAKHYPRKLVFGKCTQR